MQGFDPNGPQFQDYPQPTPQPQPPGTPQAIVPQQPQTLGGVAGAAGTAPPDDLYTTYMQAKQIADKVFAPAKTPEIQPQQHGPGWWLGNVLSFGMTGLAEHDYNQAYNRGVQHRNAAVDAMAGKAALDIVNDQQKIKSLGTQQDLAAMTLRLRMMALEEQMRQNQMKNIKDLTVGPPTTGGIDALNAIDPNARYEQIPGTSRFQIKPGTTSPGAAPGSPLANVLGPEPTAADRLTAQKTERATAAAQARASVPTMTTRTMMERAPKVIGQAQQILRDMQDLETGPLASRWREFQAGRIGIEDPAFTTYRTDAGLLPSLLSQMHVGNRPAEMIAKKFEGLIDYTKQSPANMKAALQAIIRYGKLVQAGHGPQEAADTVLGEAQSTEPTQPTGKTRTLSSGKVISEEE